VTETDDSPELIRIVVVDDHPMFREGLAAFLQTAAGHTVVGQAGSGDEAIALVDSTDVDVVLMDLHMPGMSGVEATRRIVTSHPNVAVLALTMLDDDASVIGVMQAGARGYLLKEATPDEIVRAIAGVAGGNAIFGAGVADRVLTTLAQRSARPAGLRELTDREHEILELLATGFTNTAIATRLYLSEKTVRNYVSQLFTKLAVSDRAAAVAKARDAGYGRS
jgi:DNA-binding NarL/FixJ family response regulator